MLEAGCVLIGFGAFGLVATQDAWGVVLVVVGWALVTYSDIRRERKGGQSCATQ